MFATILDAHIGATLSRMIITAFGPCAAKRASPYADVSHRTLEKTIQVRTELGAWKLLKLARHPGFRAELREYLDHIEQQEAAIDLQLKNLAAQRLRGGAGVLGASRGQARTETLRAAAAGHGVQRRGVSK